VTTLLSTFFFDSILRGSGTRGALGLTSEKKLAWQSSSEAPLVAPCDCEWLIPAEEDVGRLSPPLLQRAEEEPQEPIKDACTEAEFSVRGRGSEVGRPWRASA